MVATDEAACCKMLDLDTSLAAFDSPEHFARLMAMTCRNHMDTDFGLAIGPFPKPESVSDEGALNAYVALASADGIQTLPVSIRVHPALVRIYCAKHALNLTRLALL
jgi:nicotinamide mononucleotide (NMN) deamidase PncC